MGEALDPKKVLLPYLQRADELQKLEPLVAYHCRLYAMERGLKIPAKERGKTVNALLISLMNQLEKDKKVVKLSADDNLYLEGFASRVFAKADKQDRAGKADLSTAKTFYAASIFFEVLHQFGEIPAEIEQKQKYAVWKAADIRKALSEGRKPQAGPPDGDHDLLVAESMTWDNESGNHGTSPFCSHYMCKLGEDVWKLISFYLDNNPQHVTLTYATPIYLQNSPQKGETNPPAEFSQEDTPPGVNGTQFLRTNSIDSLPMPPSTVPASSQAVHHTRNVSSDDIDLPSAPSQPIYPSADVHHVSHSHTSTAFGAHYPAGDVHDSGGFPLSPSSRHSQVSPFSQINYTSGNANELGGASSSPSFGHSSTFDRAGPPPATFYSYSSSSQDGPGVPYSNSQNYSSYPSNLNSFNSSFYPSDQPQVFSLNPVQPSAINFSPGSTYPSASQGETFGTVHSEPSQHTRTASAPAVVEVPVSTTSGNYDSNYHPPPEKIAEAHKASRFAVGALAFDDVPTAISYLRRSLELLTVPSSKMH